MYEVDSLKRSADAFLPNVERGRECQTLAEVLGSDFRAAVVEAGDWPANLATVRLRPELVDAVGGYQELFNGLEEQQQIFDFVDFPPLS